MSTKSWYAMQLLSIPSRYGLTRNAQTALELLDDHHMGSLEPGELGRKMRMSPHLRKALSTTIRRCATIMVKTPEELKTCIQLIEMCTEILDIADSPPTIQGFPFMKLPREIRDRVILLMINHVFCSKSILPAKKKSSCNCFPMTRLFSHQTNMMKMLPSTLGRAMKDEFFVPFYRHKMFHFTCACDLFSQLDANKQLFEHVRKVKVDWSGAAADKGFLKLAQCPNLESLTVVISKATLTNLSKREHTMKKFFPLAHKSTRLTDSLGLDELLKIRGLHDVTVEHAGLGQRLNLTDFDVSHLRDLLDSFLKRPKGESEEEEEEK